MVASAEKLSFSLFGGFRIACTWRSEIEVRQARAQRLLAYLLLNRTTSPTRQRVAFAFWPDTPERQALNNLRTLLHRLRQTLPEIDQFLDLDAEILRWRSPENLFLDVARFEETLDEASEATACRDLQLEELLLESALQLYQGDLLPDYYDEWVTSTRDRLRAAYLDATERLAVLKQGQRKYADASVHVRALLQADPLRESGYRLLMQLRLAEGDRASALRAYHTCATRLRRELGVEPDPATQQLYERVLQADSAASFAPAEFALREDPSPAPVPLVGRRAEWARLVEIYQEALRGKPRAVLLTGEAGIGRTRLADEFLTYARQQGAAVASASCRSSSAVVAYAPLTAWLRSPTLRDHVRQAPHALAQEVSRLLEPLSPAHDRPRAAGEAAWQHRQLWDALVGVLIGRGRTPLVLSIDDIHWSDPLTLDWISYALQMAPSAPVVVLLTSPSSEPVSNMRLAAVRTELQERGVWVELPLEPFTLEDSAELARHALGASVTSEQVGRLHEATEGNPLFLIETIYARAEQVFERSLDGPPNHGDCPGCSDPIVLTPRIENVLRRRLDMLSEPAQSLAEIAAVIGREFTLGVLMRAARLPTDELLGALDEVWRQQLIRDRGDEHYDFSHELLRATIYEGLSPVRRKLIHHRVATALEEAGGAGTAADAALLAHHFSLAGNPRRAAEFWLAAGEWHRLLMAGQEAAGHFRRAAEAWQAAGEPERAARAFMKAGLAFQADFDSTQANEAYDAGFALTGPSPSRSIRRRVATLCRPRSSRSSIAASPVTATISR